MLSWQLLWGGMAGSEAPFHLHLITWVAAAFPSLPWWYPWDGMGVSYREGYPLAAHWAAVAVSRLLGLNLEGGAQAIQFTLMPATALGLYCYFDWRMRRPLSGLAAGLMLLLSPIGWVEWTHFGLYASWVGMVLFMPSLIALDAFFAAWVAGERGRKFRLPAVLFIVFVSAMGTISPHIVAAPLLVAPLYALALGRSSARRAWTWVLLVVPVLFLGIGLLSAFWLGAELQYLAVVHSHWAGAGTSFDINRLSPFALSGILSLQPLRSGSVDDLYSVSPAVLLPALLAIPLAWRDGRARLFLVLFLIGIVLMTDRELYRPLFFIPGFKEFGVVAHRPLQLLIIVAAPALGAAGLFELPPMLSEMAARKWTWPAGARSALALGMPVALVLVLTVDVYAFGGHVAGGGQLAYGPSLPKAPDVRDLWLRHSADVCGVPAQEWNSLCSDPKLTARFSVGQLVNACRSGGQTRADAPLCRGLQLDDSVAPKWNGDASLIAQTDSWCAGRTDPVCDARYSSLADQLFDVGQWRAPEIRCDLDCPAGRQSLATLGSTFSSAPQRAELNSNIGPLDMAFHVLVGGGITHSYNDQVLPSRELSSWLEDSMLQAPATTVKAQLAQALGIDAVVLSTQQAARAADYQALGWTQVNDDPLAFVNPQPSGLAAQWAGGSAVLVVGGTQNSVPELYNSVFKRATSGMLPFDSAWLVRGSSPYIDDYSQQDLSRYSGVIMLGYQYHDQAAAWSRVDGYVRGGGRLFVETGWQYVDPDWNAGTAPPVLPVTSLSWSALDPSAAVTVNGALDRQFGSFTYQGGGWGASSSSSLRPGASELVRSGNKIVAARWQVGQGRVVWSGMNLIAHDASSGSTDEDQFLASQFAWLYPPSDAQVAITPQWSGDNEATLELNQSDQRTLVLFKESLFPGWSARLVTPGGSRPVPLDGSEMDLMLATLDSVPAGSKLVFSYGPTVFEEAMWFLSGLWVIALGLWLVKPQLYSAGLRRVGAAVGTPGRRFAGTWDEEDGEGLPTGPIAPETEEAEVP